MNESTLMLKGKDIDPPPNRTFQYVKISSKFLDALVKKMLSNESVVLLGPRYIGKRRCMQHLADKLTTEDVKTA